MLLDILLAILIVVCLSLIGVILLQRSEGGALGMSGGGPGAFMTARGTGDLLTRTTQILAALFFGLCLAMTLISGHNHAAASLVDKLKLNALGATSSEKPLSGAPGLPGGPLNNPAAPFGAPAAPFGASQPQPQSQGNSLNLLGNPQVPLAAPVARPTAAPAPKPAAAPAPKAVKPAKPAPTSKPVEAKPAAAASSAPAPAVTPAPLTVPPPPSASPAAGGAGNSTSGQ
ncbi:MAG TPA: preprotein translocase subunit SecG [Caulobacteraceae bacterium]|jgi:preprotein translocase subunit SecG|nr:preprotein translocase subunit SecG [Caulobacteraceae bacterium]